MKVSLQALPWFLLGVVTTLFVTQSENRIVAEAAGTQAATQKSQDSRTPKILHGRTELTFRRGKIYANETVSLSAEEFKGTPSIVACESGSSGSWAFIKAENFKADSFDIAGLRDPAGKNKKYTAQVAWIAVGESAE